MSCLSILIVLLYTYCEFIMSIKSSAMAITAAAALTLTTANCDSPLNKNKKQEIAEVLADSTSNNIDWLQIQAQKSDSIDLTKENSDTCFTVHMKDLEGWPLFWKKRMIVPNYWNLLGYSQAETIMKNYNNNWDKPFDVYDRLSENDTINIPLIYPELKSYFPENLSELSKKLPEYETINDPHLNVVTQLDNWKNALAYYKNWKLKVATYVSIGKGKRTPTWEYTLKRDSVFRRSREFNNAPMPNAMHIDWAWKWGVFTHQWEGNGYPLSHWCIRVPWFYQHYLYYELPEESTIVLVGLYTSTLTKM